MTPPVNDAADAAGTARPGRVRLPPPTEPSGSLVDQFPGTYPSGPADARLRQPQVFEPALKHFARAFRLGEPTAFDPPSLAGPWLRCRRAAMDHVLRAVAGTRWRPHLILRGSVLLKAWLGDVAREPGDLDWLVAPPTLKLTDAPAEEMFVELATAVVAAPTDGAFAFDADAVSTDNIWTYDRAPGRRIVFPWQAEGLPSGRVQVDLVFGDEPWAEPIELNLWDADRSFVSIRAATPEASLAWKIQWLESDGHPQGKDLYDATLLAERFRLPAALLKRRAIDAAVDARWRPPLTPELVSRWDIDWENFVVEYPWVTGTADEWKTRLTDALRPTFQEAAAAGLA